MKRILLLIISLLVLLAGCTKQIEQTEPIKEEHDIDFRTGIHWTQFWKTETIEDSDYCVIPDEDAAVKIATAIYKELPIRTYVAQSVFYDEQEEVWVVEFYAPLPESGPMPTDQPTHTIALRKKDGKVLSIFVD